MEFSRPEYWSGYLFPSPGLSSQPRNQTQVSRIAGRFFTSWVTREAQKYWSGFSPADLPDPGNELVSPALQADFSPTELSGKLRLYSQSHREASKRIKRELLFPLSESGYLLTHPDSSWNHLWWTDGEGPCIFCCGHSSCLVRFIQ